jgi:hypothetical protein
VEAIDGAMLWSRDGWWLMKLKSRMRNIGCEVAAEPPGNDQPPVSYPPNSGNCHHRAL